MPTVEVRYMIDDVEAALDSCTIQSRCRCGNAALRRRIDRSL